FQWEPQAHRITYANAGHCRPVLLTPGEVDMMAYSDIILGLDANAAFTDQSLALPPGSAFITYTDGLMEQRLQNGEMVGERGIMEIAREVAHEADPVAAMLQIILERSETPEFGDDILVFWLQRDR